MLPTLSRYEQAKTNEIMGTVVVDRMVDAVTMLLFVGAAFLLDGGRIFGYLTRNAQIDSLGSILLSPWFWFLVFLIAGIVVLFYRYRSRLGGHPVIARIIELWLGFRDGLK